ncbi:MAG: MASE1 domain-containing protein [Candidatus Omnitrophica bacterium]|nr:MASE1 domain-containing protein [Candidatus Omnitrophota bacterium]
MKVLVSSSTPRYLLETVGLTVIYFLTARFGLMMDAVSGFATLVWPPTGIFLALLLLFGYRYWPSVALGAFLTNVSIGAPVLVACGISLGNTLEAFLGAYFVRHIVGFRRSLERVQDVLGLVVLAAFLSTMVSASLGTTSLWLGKVISGADYGMTWRAWWLGDMVGDLVVAPVLLVWWGRLSLEGGKGERVIEAMALFLSLFSVGCLVFLNPTFIKGYPPLHFLFPFLIWSALRFGQRSTVMVVLITSVTGILGEVMGSGPIVTEKLSESLLLFQFFMATYAVTGMLLAAVSIQQKRAETVIKEHEETLGSIIEGAIDAVIVMNAHGIITFWNLRAEQIFGWPAREAIGKKMSETIIPVRYRDAHAEGLRRFLKTGEGPILNKMIEMPALRRDGSEFPVELVVSASYLRGERFFSAFVRDITERKQAEERRTQMLKEVESVNKELSDFAYIVSHDLKAPLRGIGAVAEWLAHDYKEKLGPKGKEFLRLMNQRIDLARSLIDGILEYSRVGRVRQKMKEVNLNELVQTVVDILVLPENIAVQIEGDLPTLYCERIRIQQLFQNLLTNAVKYMDKAKGEIKIACVSDDGHWRFSVSDNGPGIEEKYFEKIFQMFQTLQPKDRIQSTGVGLALVKKIVEMYGGRIWVESTVGKGSSFFFTLPKGKVKPLETN